VNDIAELSLKELAGAIKRRKVASINGSRH
jgi:hypothetical protein